VVERLLQVKKYVLGNKAVPVPFCAKQILRGHSRDISWTSALTDRSLIAWFIKLLVTWREWQNTESIDFNSPFQKRDMYILIFIISYRMFNKMSVQTLQLHNLWRLKLLSATFVKLYLHEKQKYSKKNLPIDTSFIQNLATGPLQWEAFERL
jgi:hypothetical protein